MTWIAIIGFSLISIILILLPFWRKKRLQQADSNTQSEQPVSENQKYLLLMKVAAISLPILAYGTYILLEEKTATVSVKSPSSVPAPTTGKHNSDLNEMITRLEAKLEKNPNDKKGWNLLARSYLYIKDYSQALKALNKSAEFTPDDQELQQRIRQTRALLNKGVTVEQPIGKIMQGPDGQTVNVGAMVERLRKKLKSDPNNIQGWMMLGRSYKNLGQLDDSLNAYRSAEKLKPNDSNIKQIIKSIDDEISSKQKNSPLINSTKNTFSHTDINARIKTLEEKVKKDPSNIDNSMMLARSYMKQKNYDKAVTTLTQALTKSPNDINLIVPLADAIAMANGGKLNSRSQQLINQALIIEPNHPIALWLAGIAERDNKNYKAALTHWKKLNGLLQKDSPDSIELQSLIGRAEEELK